MMDVRDLDHFSKIKGLIDKKDNSNKVAAK